MAYLRLKLFDHSDPIAICKVIFTPDRRSYQSGDLLQGLLIVSLTAKRELRFHGFKVVLEGLALTKYNDRRELLENRTETFLEIHKYVYGKEPAQPNSLQIGMAPGVHKFPFAFRIPAGLPGTFNSPFGTLSYQVAAYIHMPHNRILQKAEKTFDLKSRLNLDTSVLTSVDFEQVLGGNTCQIKVILRMVQCGFLVGEEIPFGLELQNPSTLEVTNVSVSLVQKGIYHPGNLRRSTQTSTVVATKTTTNLDGCYGADWTWAESLRIPPGVRTTYAKGIIQSHYCLKIDVVIGSGSETGILSTEVPVVIGTSIEGSQATSPIIATTCARQSTSISPTPSTSRQFLESQHLSVDLEALSINPADPRRKDSLPSSSAKLKVTSAPRSFQPKEPMVEKSDDESSCL